MCSAGGLRESHENEIEIVDVNSSTELAAFKQLLKYVYTGRVSLAEMREDLILSVLGLAHKYGFIELEDAISDYLRSNLNIRNVCSFYDTANLYGLEKLGKECCAFIDLHAADVIRHESFLSLSPPALKDMISRGKLLELTCVTDLRH